MTRWTQESLLTVRGVVFVAACALIVIAYVFSRLAGH